MMDDDRLRELFDSVAPIRIRRMFGGQGIYADGLIVAIVVDGELMMKADAETASIFESTGSRRWSYERKAGVPVAMPYWTLPEEAHDDPAAMAAFAALSMAAARRGAASSARPAKAPCATKACDAREPQAFVIEEAAYRFRA